MTEFKKGDIIKFKLGYRSYYYILLGGEPWWSIARFVSTGSQSRVTQTDLRYYTEDLRGFIL